MFIVVCVRRSSTFVTKDHSIFYHVFMCAERNKLWRVFSTAIDLVKAKLEEVYLCSLLKSQYSGGPLAYPYLTQA